MNASVNYKSQAAFETAMKVYERTLSQWPVPAEQLTVPTRHGDTFGLAFGNRANPPLVLLHGSAANLSSWLGDAERFASAFRVYALDLPGETGKSTGNRPPYAGSTYADWLSDAFDALAVPRAGIVGLSLGGWAALKFAAAAPHRIDRLVLLAPGGVAPARKSFLLKAVLYSPFGAWGNRQITRVVFAPQPIPKGMAEAFSFLPKLYNARRDTLPLLTDEELASVTAPTLLIGGVHDALLDMPATSGRLSRLIPRLTSELDPELGHAAFGKGERILRFLDAAVPAPA